MNKADGFIVLRKKIVDWEWYRDTNTFCLFVHLLLAANFEEARFEGMVVNRGQLVTSLPSLSKETGLSIRQTRTALEHLISTGEVTNKSYTKYRVITIVNYDKYQNKRQTKWQTNDSQTTDNLTAKRQQYNNINNINNSLSLTGERGTTKQFMPPTIDEVKAYVKEIGGSIDPERFVDHYTTTGWVLKGGQKIKDWKSAVRNWERREKKDGRDRTDAGSTESESRSDFSFLRDSVTYV